MVVSALRITGKIKDLKDALERLDSRSFEYYKRIALSEAAALEAARIRGAS